MRVSFSKEEQLYTDFYFHYRLKYAPQNNSNEEEMKKKLKILTQLEHFKKIFSFFIGTNVNKIVKHKQFICRFEDKIPF